MLCEQRNVTGCAPMKELFQLPGIVSVLNTPFLADDSLDLDGLRQNVEYAIDAGVAGFLVPAMAAEVGNLSARERGALVETVVQTVEGRVPVIGGASAPDRAGRRDAARELVRIGCAGILANIPFDHEEQYLRDAAELASLGPGFLMLQDWDFAGGGLPLPVVVRVFKEVESFRCLKIETANACAKYTAVLAATDGRLHVSGGWAVTQMIEGLDRGVHAFMPTGLHRAYVRIFSQYTGGARDRAVDLFRRLSPILSFSNQSLDVSIRFFKRLLHAQGIYATPRVRIPRTILDPGHDARESDLIRVAIQIENELTSNL